MDKTIADPAPQDGAHLPPERLAALADEPASPSETAHLASCAICAEEVASYQALLTLTREERDRLGEPLTSWPALSEALANEQLLVGRPPLKAHAHRRPRPSRLQPLAQTAAAVVLIASGVMVGRLTARPTSRQPTPSGRDQSPGGMVVSDSGIEPSTRLISDTTAFTSRGQALDALEQAEARYRHAVAYLMESDSSTLVEGADGYRARLAALEQVERATRAALVAAPDDPVLNQWYISTVGAQQATIRQLVQSHPLSQSPHRY